MERFGLALPLPLLESEVGIGRFGTGNWLRDTTRLSVLGYSTQRTIVRVTVAVIALVDALSGFPFTCMCRKCGAILLLIWMRVLVQCSYDLMLKPS